MKLHRFLFFYLPLICLAAACKLAEADSVNLSSMPITASPGRIVTEALTPASSALPSQASPTPTAAILETATPPSPSATMLTICSPLQDITISKINDLVSNPFSPPPPGSDDPHQGTDFADLFGAERIAVPGRQVNAVLPGTVVAIIKDRFPYGNAVLVETMIQDLPKAWWERLPTPAPTPQRKVALTCPEDIESPFSDTPRRSLYLLYAHMQEPPALQPGDSLSCGQKIGNIGSSGNALNPHLHLEARVGPSGARFPGMAHYESRATPEEMSAYCLWRISGFFQPVDPLSILSLTDR
jgi:murein DD-endopeptidase MepM/ murein hydrolase activator NlpD